MSTSVRSFVKSPLMMQPSSPVLSLVTRAGFMVITLRQSNNPPNGKWRAKSRACWSFFYIKRSVHKEYVLTGQRASCLYCSDILQWLHESIRDSALNFGDKGSGCCTATHLFTLPFLSGNFWPKTTWLSSSTHPTDLTWPPVTFLFPWLK
jgi:hypothetical protein